MMFLATTYWMVIYSMVAVGGVPYSIGPMGSKPDCKFVAEQMVKEFGARKTACIEIPALEPHGSGK